MALNPLVPISKTLGVVKTTAGLTQKTLRGISNILIEKNKDRKIISSSIKNLKQRRIQDSRRKITQDAITAPSIITSYRGPESLSQRSDNTNFTSRITGFLGYLAGGWALSNLPTWTSIGNQLITRIGETKEVITQFGGSIQKFMFDIGDVFSSAFLNIKQFDFTDSSGRLRNSLDVLSLTVTTMGNQLEEALSILSKPFTDVPPLGQKSNEPSAYDRNPRPTPPPPPGTKYNIKQLVKLALQVGFKGQNAAVAASVAMAESTGDPTIDTVKSGTDPQMKNEYSIGLWQINWLAHKTGTLKRMGVTDPDQLRDPLTNAKAAYKLSGGSNFKPWTTFKNGEYLSYLPEAIKALTSGSAQSSTLPTVPTTPTSPQIKGKTPGYSQAVSFGKSLLSKGYKNVWQHPDFNWSSGYTGSGKERVAPRDYNSYHNYGEALDISAYNGEGKLDALYAFLSKNKSKYGIAELLWRVKDHYDHMHISFNKLGSTLTPSQSIESNKTPDSTTVNNDGEELQINPASFESFSKMLQDLTLDQNGRKIMIIDDRKPTQSLRMYSGGGDIISSDVNEFTLVNNFMKNKLLLDLTYL